MLIKFMVLASLGRGNMVKSSALTPECLSLQNSLGGRGVEMKIQKWKPQGPHSLRDSWEGEPEAQQVEPFGAGKDCQGRFLYRHCCWGSGVGSLWGWLLLRRPELPRWVFSRKMWTGQ